jgi:class 3 adenylate cyclase
VVDKFVGDAVMVVFREASHFSRAVEACLAIRKQLQAMALRYGDDSPYSHGVGIGLDSGELISGSIGAKGLSRLDYTVIGETVNTAARLAVLANKEQILIAEHLLERVEGSYECLPLGTKGLPGSTVELNVHDIVRRRQEGVSTSDQTASIEQHGPRGAAQPAPLLAAKPE